MFFVNETVGAGFPCGSAKFFPGMIGDDDDTRHGEPFLEPACGCQPIQAGHLDVHQDPVRPFGGIERQDLARVGAFQYR